jgi:hypothetical protein
MQHSSDDTKTLDIGAAILNSRSEGQVDVNSVKPKTYVQK